MQTNKIKVTKRDLSVALAAVTLVVGTSSMAGSVSLPNVFVPGTPIVAGNVNDNFTALEMEVNDNAGGVVVSVDCTSNADALQAAITASSPNPTAFWTFSIIGDCAGVSIIERSNIRLIGPGRGGQGSITGSNGPALVVTRSNNIEVNDFDLFAPTGSGVVLVSEDSSLFLKAVRITTAAAGMGISGSGGGGAGGAGKALALGSTNLQVSENSYLKYDVGEVDSVSVSGNSRMLLEYGFINTQTNVEQNSSLKVFADSNVNGSANIAMNSSVRLEAGGQDVNGNPFIPRWFALPSPSPSQSGSTRLRYNSSFFSPQDVVNYLGESSAGTGDASSFFDCIDDNGIASSVASDLGFSSGFDDLCQP